MEDPPLIVKEFLDAFWDAHPNDRVGNELPIDVEGLGDEFMMKVVQKFKELYDADSPDALDFLDKIIKSYEEPDDEDEPHVIAYESGGIEKVFDLNSFYQVPPPFGHLLRIVEGIHTLISHDHVADPGMYADTYVSEIEHCKSLERDPNSPDQTIIDIVGEIFRDTEKYPIPEVLHGRNYFDGDLGYVADDFFIDNNNNNSNNNNNNNAVGGRRRKTRKAKRSKRTKKVRRHKKGKTGKKQRKGRRTHRRS